MSAGAQKHQPLAAGQRSLPRAWLAATLLIGAGTLAYANSFSGVFVFDDRLEIVKNPALERLWPPGRAMLGGKTMPARPLPYYTFALNYALHSTSLWGYHAVNLAIHLAAGLVLFGLIRRTLAMPRVPPRYQTAADGLALAAALLWLVHPLQTESVTYIYQRMESLMGLFYLLTLYCFVRGAASPRPRLWLEAAVLCCAAGMGSKEVMVTAPLLVLWYDRVFVAADWRELFRRRWPFYAALAATWIIVVAVMRCQADLYRETDAASMPCTAWRYALNQPIVIWHYLRLAFFPRGLCLHYHWPGAATFAEMVVPGLALLALLAATAWCMVRQPALGFLAGSFFLVLSVTSSVVPVFDMIFEHRMYLSLAAVATLVVLGAFDVLSFLLPLPPGSWRRLCLHAAPAAVAAVALAATTYRAQLCLCQPGRHVAGRGRKMPAERDRREMPGHRLRRAASLRGVDRGLPACPGIGRGVARGAGPRLAGRSPHQPRRFALEHGKPSRGDARLRSGRAYRSDVCRRVSQHGHAVSASFASRPAPAMLRESHRVEAGVRAVLLQPGSGVGAERRRGRLPLL